MTDTELVAKSVVDQYKSRVPLSVAMSLCSLVKLFGEVFPVTYKTHFEPFIKYRDITKYIIVYSKDKDGIFRFNLKSISIGPIDYDNDDLQNEISDLVASLTTFNFRWDDKYSTEYYDEWVLDQNLQFRENRIIETTLVLETT